MKEVFLTGLLILGLLVPYSLAQKGDTGGVMEGQKGGMEKGQMMSREMLQNMTGMMSQMDELLEKMAHPMGHRTITEHRTMDEMGRIMRDMAAQMNEMATHMEKGSMDQATVGKMHEKMKAARESIEKLRMRPE
ncbi:MAG: hypothetical protein M1497_03530 [Nitrospirae bacterium]|nr:hypothetical protein [Nitrospirota bacterium]